MHTIDGGDASDGIRCNVFGPITWTVLHIYASGFPAIVKSQQEYNRAVSFTKLIDGVVGSLPCKTCRKHTVDILKQMNYRGQVFANRNAAERFVYDLHTNVNKRIKKNYNPPAFETVVSYYNKFRSSSTPLRANLQFVRDLSFD